MSANTTIEWTDATWPIVAGCEKVTRECKHCWAIRDSWRLAHNPHEAVRKVYEGTVHKVGSQLAWTGLVRPIPERLDWPLTWRAPRKIFVCSQSDLFHADVPDEFIDRAFAVMALARRHTYQVLTKRPERMLAYLSALTWERLIAACNRSADGGEHRPSAYSLSSIDGRSMKARFVAGEKDAHGPLPKPPLKNVHLGFSAGDQETFDERWPHMARLAADGWLVWASLEPMFGPVDASHAMWPTHWHWDAKFKTHEAALAAGAYAERKRQGLVSAHAGFLRWIVAGGESGSKATPSHPDWFRSLRDQCAAAGVPFLFKQWGEWSSAYSFDARHLFVDPATGAIDDPSARMGARGLPVQNANSMFRFGKKAAGRMLDGRTHDQFPDTHTKESA